MNNCAHCDDSGLMDGDQSYCFCSAGAKRFEAEQGPFELAPSVVDVGTITEYGLTQKLSQNVRVF